MYIGIFSLLRDAVRRKRHEKWRTKIYFLLHDNAPTHRSGLAKYFLRKNSVTTLEIPPYSSDLATDYFYLFIRLISALKGRRYCDANGTMKNATKELKMLLQTGFQKFLQELYICWQKFRFAQGGYFEVNVA
jgi:transposase